MEWANWKKKADSVCKNLRRYEGFENCNVGCMVLESGETQWTVYIGKSVMKFSSGPDVDPKVLAEHINKRMKHHL